MSEIVFEVREDAAESGYTAAALGYGIHTQGETLEELRVMVKERRQLLLRRHHGLS